MELNYRKVATVLDVEKLMNAALRPEDPVIKPNHLITAGGMLGRRDPLTEVQQKIVISAISLIYRAGESSPNTTVCKMDINEFLDICEIEPENIYTYLTGEVDKLLRKGVFLYDEKTRRLTRTLWFQAVEFGDSEITFQFAESILPLITKFSPGEAEYQLVKGLQYKGKHTLAVFDIIWSSKDNGVTEYSIPELMRLLSLEHTRYSYGQLKLRVLEPSFEEIYAWDDSIFVRFGPTFSGRRVEGVWFDVTVGEEAKVLRKEEPEFRFARPNEKPDKEF